MDLKRIQRAGDFAERTGVYHFAYTAANAGALTVTNAMACLTLDSTDGALTVTLPKVEQAAGLTFSFMCKTYSSAITIQDNDDSDDWTNISLDAAQDGALLYSDGRKWWVLVDNYS